MQFSIAVCLRAARISYSISRERTFEVAFHSSTSICWICILCREHLYLRSFTAFIFQFIFSMYGSGSVPEAQALCTMYVLYRQTKIAIERVRLNALCICCGFIVRRKTILIKTLHYYYYMRSVFFYFFFFFFISRVFMISLYLIYFVTTCTFCFEINSDFSSLGCIG